VQWWEALPNLGVVASNGAPAMVFFYRLT